MSTSETQKESPMMAEPQKEHQWLQKLVGEWAYEMESEMGPDAPTETCNGSESVRTLGKLSMRHWPSAKRRRKKPRLRPCR